MIRVISQPQTSHITKGISKVRCTQRPNTTCKQTWCIISAKNYDGFTWRGIVSHPHQILKAQIHPGQRQAWTAAIECGKQFSNSHATVDQPKNANTLYSQIMSTPKEQKEDSLQNQHPPSNDSATDQQDCCTLVSLARNTKAHTCTTCSLAILLSYRIYRTSMGIMIADVVIFGALVHAMLHALTHKIFYCKRLTDLWLSTYSR